MNWIFLALASHFFWGLVNIGDKYLVSRKFKNPYVYMVLLIWAGIIGLFLIPFVDFHFPDFKILFWLIIGAMFNVSGSLLYVKSVQKEDISRINIWWNLIPLFSLVIAWLTINEHLNSNQLLAFGVLIIGSFLASLKFRKKSVGFSKTFGWMLLSILCYSVSAVVIRFAAQAESVMVIFILVNILGVFMSAPLFFWPTFRHDFCHDLKSISLKVKGIVLGIALFDIAGNLLNIMALALGPVALVYAMEGTQSIFVFLMVLLISFFRPSFIKEEFDKYNFLAKFAALAVIVAGVIMLNLS